MEWDGSLETGHELVDEQHRELIAIFNEITRTAPSADDQAHVGEILVRLSDYVSTHFSEEEALMMRHGYPDERVRAHQEQHADLSGRTRELVLAHREGEWASIVPLAALLQEWLSEHILTTDTRLVAYLRETQAGRGC